MQFIPEKNLQNLRGVRVNLDNSNYYEILVQKTPSLRSNGIEKAL